MSEIDLTLALQLKAQFEEEARVSLLQQLAHQQSAEEAVLRQGALSTGSSSSSGRKQTRDENLSEPQQEKLPVPLVDPSWELIDPNPEVHALFLTFNHQFFWGRLAGVEVRWSPRMTLCAGVCSYEGRGGLCSVRLSVPLLKLRPRKDLIETLLHEMIHAYLFVTANNRDRDGHGPEFHKHMCRINNVAGTNISVYHSFHDEVDVYRQHVWRCNGSCRSRHPYFGLVKRAMNRAPGPRDPWWQRHQDACGGTYTKIQEPEGYGAKKQKKDAKKNDNFGDIRKFVEFNGKGNSISGPSSAPTGRQHLQVDDVSSKSRNAERPQVIDIASDFRAQKSIDFGVNRKSKSNVFDIDANKCNKVRKDRDNLFTGNGIRANDKRKNNIREFNNTATGSVKRVDVSNASKSNVHGFGGGGSPAMKKPNRGSSEVGKSGRGVGRVSGQVMHGGGGRGDVMEHGHGQDSNTRGGLSSVRGGRSRGGGLVTRGRGGSSTVTVKGRGITRTETRTNDADEVNKQSSQALFQGQGFSLGGGGMGVSRLLTLANSSLHSSPPVSPPLQSCHAPFNSTVMSTSTSEPGSRGKGDNTVYSKQESQYSRSPSPEPDRGDSSMCPLCNSHIPGASLSQHLDDCMGMFDDRMSIDGENEDESMEIQDPRPHKVESESDDCLVIGAASGMSDEVKASGECRVGGTSRVLGEDGREEVYPCPVCGENYSQANINQHLDKHF